MHRGQALQKKTAQHETRARCRGSAARAEGSAGIMYYAQPATARRLCASSSVGLQARHEVTHDRPPLSRTNAQPREEATLLPLRTPTRSEITTGAACEQTTHHACATRSGRARAMPARAKGSRAERETPTQNGRGRHGAPPSSLLLDRYSEFHASHYPPNTHTHRVQIRGD